MRLLLTFCLALPLTAGWNYSGLSGATETAFVSRLISFGGDVPQERNYVAYRDASGSLAVARFSVGFTPVTVWPGVSPSNTFVSLSPTGTLLVTFWNNNQYRYAMSSPNGIGNCGPILKYRCRTVPLMTGFTTTAIERIVGEVDSDGTARFVYAQRSPGFEGNRLVSAIRSPAGVWSTEKLGAVPGDGSFSPVNFSYGLTQTGAPPSSWVTGTAIYGPLYVHVENQYAAGPSLSWKTAFMNSERRPLSRAHCTNRSIPPAEPISIWVHRRQGNLYQYDSGEIFAGSVSFSATKRLGRVDR